MDSLAIELLTLYNKRSSLSYADVAAIKNQSLGNLLAALSELRTSGYIAADAFGFEAMTLPTPNTKMKITQAGRSKLFEIRQDNRRFRLPLIISVIAIIIALASILLDIVQ